MNNPSELVDTTKQNPDNYKPLGNDEQRELLDLTIDAILVRTLDGHIRYWNKGAEKLYGWTKEEAVGNTSHNILKTVFPIPLNDILNRLQTEGYWSGELIHTTKGGGQVSVSSRWSLREDTDHSPDVLELNTDITAQKKAEERLRSELEKTKKINDILLANEVEIVTLKKKIADLEN